MSDQRRFIVLGVVSFLSALLMLSATQTTLSNIDQSLAAVTTTSGTLTNTLKSLNAAKQAPIYQFPRTLKLGTTGNDVKQLQIYLNSDPTTIVSKTGVGSKGKESTYYGPATSKAVSKFQLKYKSDILTPSHLTQGTGYFGPASLKKLNALLIAQSKLPGGSLTLTNLTTALCPNGKTIVSNCTSYATTTRALTSGGGGGGYPTSGGDYTPPVTLPPSPTPGALTPIGRWDVVPYQRINNGETFNASVVAFSAVGINRVVFSITGHGYTGGVKSVSAMSLNPQTNVWEYWVPIRASEFTSDGPVTIEATVYGNDGGIRNKNTDDGGQGLDALVLNVNPNGTLAQPTAWVDVSGDDDTGAVGNSSLPFATVGKAISALATANGGDAGGGIVRLDPGTHTMSRGGINSAIPTTNEWMTITTASGGTKTNTILQGGDGGTPDVGLLKVDGITLSSNAEGVYAINFYALPDSRIWVNDNNIIGPGRWLDNGYVIYGSAYYTNDYITNIRFATANGIFARGLTIEHIGDDAFRQMPMVVNSTVDDIDPGTSGYHSDAYQLWWNPGMGPIGNIIVYGYRATNLKYQGLFISDPPPDDPSFVLDGSAFVNNYIDISPDALQNGGFSSYGISTNHLVFWNNSFPGSKGYFRFGGNMTNLSMIGNLFQTFNDYGTSADYTNSHDNHYVDGGGMRGADATSGAAGLDVNGLPTVSSVLRDRITPSLVPIDLAGVNRGATSDVGAYESGLVSIPTVTISASPTTVTSGNTASITWSSTDATSCTASGGWSGSRSTSGSETSIALTTSTTFTLTCTGAGGSASQSASVTVTNGDGSPLTCQNSLITNGLVGWWTFDSADISGSTASDCSNNANNGTLVGPPASVSGQLGQALSFPGDINTSVDVGTSDSLNIQGPITVSAWVRPTDVSATEAIVKAGTSWSWGSNLYEMFIYADTGRSLNFDSRGDTLNTSITFNLNTWTHVACTVDDSNLMRCYKNGVADNATLQRTTLSSPTYNGVYISKGAGDQIPFFGSIDDVRIYNRALSASEVGQLYNGTLAYHQETPASDHNQTFLASVLSAFQTTSSNILHFFGF